MERISVAVAGATGYVGAELVRLLCAHPRVRLVALTSEQHAGSRMAAVYPSLRGRVDVVLEPLDPVAIAGRAEVVFAALPHGHSAAVVAAFLDQGRRVLDLSADFRLRDPEVYARWYAAHPVPRLLAEAVYGLPEFYAEAIRGARLVAVPGCYPTGTLLGTVPLLRGGCLDPDAIITVDAKSGATGAGRSARTDLLFCEVDDSIRPYGIGVHRHTPEMEQELSRAAGRPVPVLFAPHLLPIRRGILSTIYLRLARGITVDRCGQVFREAYAGAPFVDLLGAGTYPTLRDVQGTNRCAVGWWGDDARGLLVVTTAIDNLGKGAAGQAVECLNLQLGCPRNTGLDQLAVVP